MHEPCEVRGHGGRTEEGLLTAICSRCHAMVHQGLLQLYPDPEGGFAFFDRSGTGVEAKTPPVSVLSVAKRIVHTIPASGPESSHTVVGRRLLLIRSRQELAPRPEWDQYTNPYVHVGAREWL